MTIEIFNNLKEQQKVQLVFDANKITEKVDDEANYQLFQIDDFFVETRTSLEGKFKRTFTTYSLKELPVEYVGEVLAIPIVVLDGQSQENEFKKATVKSKKGVYSKTR